MGVSEKEIIKIKKFYSHPKKMFSNNYKIESELKNYSLKHLITRRAVN